MLSLEKALLNLLRGSYIDYVIADGEGCAQINTILCWGEGWGALSRVQKKWPEYSFGAFSTSRFAPTALSLVPLKEVIIFRDTETNTHFLSFRGVHNWSLRKWPFLWHTDIFHLSRGSQPELNKNSRSRDFSSQLQFFSLHYVKWFSTVPISSQNTKTRSSKDEW